MTHDSRTTRRQTCRACAAVTSGDCGQHESHIAMLRTWVAKDSKLPRTVTIEAGLLDELIDAHERLAFEYLTEYQRQHVEVYSLLARVRAAREGR